MKLIMKYFIYLAVIFFFCSCGNNSTDYSGDAAMEVKELARTAEVQPTRPDGPSGEIYKKMIIKNAEIQFVVEDIDAATDDIKQSIREFNGYISEEREESSNDRHTIYLTIRVPNQDFDTLVEAITHQRPKIDYKRISANDVSEEYYDLKTRLETQREIEKRYIELLDRAKTVSDILEIERELGNIRTEIESKEGRIKRLENQVSYSTINLSFYEYVDYKFQPESGLNFFERAKDALYSGWRGLVSFTVFMINLWPVFLITFIVIFIIRKSIKKVVKNKKV